MRTVATEADACRHVPTDKLWRLQLVGSRVTETVCPSANQTITYSDTCARHDGMRCMRCGTVRCRWSPLRFCQAHSEQHILWEGCLMATVTSLSRRMTMQDCNHIIEHTSNNCSLGGWTRLARTRLKELCVCTHQSGLPIAQTNTLKD